jgi:hypothetical protein
MMEPVLHAGDRYAFDVRGYLRYDDVLRRDQLRALRDAIRAQRLPEPGESVGEQRFGAQGAMLGWHRAFRDLIDHPLVVRLLREFIGPYVRLDHAYGIMMKPGTSGLGLHGPATPFDPSQYYVHRSGHIRTGLLSFAWALSDARPGDGGFGCIPGSHRADEPVPVDADRLVTEVPQPAGSLLVFTEALVHRTIPWRGDETRWTLLYKYSPGSSAWDPAPAAPPDVVDMMSARQRRLLDPPFVGGRRPAVE